MEKYVCIHGHFYQPPRENPWLESIEYQESAHPFHDWNERINAECYAPNAASRILDKNGLITKIVNNYTKISFNIGATLLSWMQLKDPETYQAILEADKASLKYFSGHGSAIAQVYSHLIMPLANERDKRTQIVWGIKDFEYRFGRKPEGMWLAETAVDTPTLEILAEEGILYTILAPRQAKAFRQEGATDWQPLPYGRIDPRYPYWCNLPSGKRIALFFYDGQVAQDVAFNHLLHSGKAFANRLLGTLDNNAAEPQIAHIATDGESYGHHHYHGEMALADCINYIERLEGVKMTNYGAFLAKYPPTREVQIYENSSWSCVHGVERWRSDCGCHTGGKAGWTQRWRKPLRDALDWLNERLIDIFETKAAVYFDDPWAVRDAYIEVILDRTEAKVVEFLQKNARQPITEADYAQMLRLLEMQRNALLMYTSCGWFFNEISGIETTQILQYACRSLYYANQVDGVDLQDEFIRQLEAAPSNVESYKNGGEIYRQLVLPTEVGLERMGMHYAVSSLFAKHPETLEVFNYTADSDFFDRMKAGRFRLSVGRTVVKSKITLSEKRFTFAVLYLGQQHIMGYISIPMNLSEFEQLHEEIKTAFYASNIGEVIRSLQFYFGVQKYSIDSLFKDEKWKILNRLVAKNLESAEVMLREIYQDNYHLMNTLLQNNLHVTDQYREIVQYVLNADLKRYFEQDLLSFSELERIASEFKKWDVRIEDKNALQLVANESIFNFLRQFEQQPLDLERMEQVSLIFEQIQRLGIPLNGWKAQNEYFALATSSEAIKRYQADEKWKFAFQKIGKYLGVGVASEAMEVSTP